jgi:hypothetical protein
MCTNERLELVNRCNVKNVVSWDVAPCGSCYNRCFVGAFRLHHHVGNNLHARNNVSSN